MRSMKGMSITNLMILLVIGSSVMIGIGSFYNDITNTYGINNNSTSYTTFQKFNTSVSNLNTPLLQMQKDTSGAVSSGISFTGILDVSAVFLDVGQILFKLPGMMNSFVGMVVSTFTGNAIAIPDWVGTMIITVILIIVIMQVIRIFTKSFFEV